MPKNVRRRHTTFLVAMTAGPAGAAAGGAVYAVMARGPEEALRMVRACADPGSAVAVVGALSSRMAKAIRLAAGEVRPV